MLRLVGPPDLAWIESAAYRPDASWRWRTRGVTLSPDSLSRRLWEGVESQWVAVSPDARPLGLIQLYDVDIRNGNAYLSVLYASDAALEGDVAEACGRAFDSFRLRNVYVIASDRHLRRVERDLPPFEREGELKEYEFTDGQYESLNYVVVRSDR
jgi:hypothetical protein